MEKANGSSGRNTVIDVLRGLAIALVVLGHANRGRMEAVGSAVLGPAYSRADFIIYTTHMPTFFLLAGYFSFKTIGRDGARAFLASRGWAVIFPYILWSLLLWAPRYLGGGLVNKPLPFNSVLHIAYAPISIYWFLYALTVLQLIAAALYPRAIVFAVAALAGLALVTGGTGAPIVSETLEQAPFFALGLILARYGQPALPALLHRVPVIVALAVIFAAGCVLALTLGAKDPVSLAMLPVDLAGVMALAGIAQRLMPSEGEPSPVTRHIATLGRLSLPIYLTHIFALSAVPRMLGAIHLASTPVYYLLSLAVGLYGPLLFFALASRIGVAGWLGLTGRSPLRVRPTSVHALGQSSSQLR